MIGFTKSKFSLKFPQPFKVFLASFRDLETRELVIIGLFAGAAKMTTILVTLVGGGMNPLTMVLKSAIFSTLWVIMLVKVPKFGALTLANTISGLLSLFLMGQSMISLPGLLITTLVVELIFKSLGGYRGNLIFPIMAIALSELLARLINIFMAYLSLREQPSLLFLVGIISSLSYLGIFIGLFGGQKMVKELRHAGLIQD